MAVYVDDIFLGGKSESKLIAAKEELIKQKFEIKDLGTTSSLPRKKVIQDLITEVSWIS